MRITTILLVGMIIAILGIIAGAYMGGMIGVSIANYLLDNPQEQPSFVPYEFPENYTNCTGCLGNWNRTWTNRTYTNFTGNTTNWTVPEGVTCLDYYIGSYGEKLEGGGCGLGNATPSLHPLSTLDGYTNLSYAGGSGGGSFNGSTLPEFNLTACDEDAKHLGQNCTCMECGYWMGYETQGFYNHSGVYYSDGTSTGRTMKQMEDFEERQSDRKSVV